MRFIVKHLISIIFAIIIVLLIQAFVITGAVIKNDWMAPNLKQDDRIIVNKIKTTFNILDNNDIIMYRKGDEIQFSRIIGKPGQSIAYKNGTLYRDDRAVDELYASNSINDLSLRNIQQSEGDIIPPNAYFVLNDNRENKQDSRTTGFIQKEDIIGNVSLRYFPFEKFTVNFD
ncbi:MAG: signal peptidase I [Staphylococcus equorum]|uniref:signal peptidase I n=1 Tax=Staphylococcus equorum TaxID=246432 RepID=UPI000CD14260|nr:signal peptidase I [Staphylococcus equorum]MDK9842518.1 signal peptidase I [Staphylococcus equorum]PNZ07803.1 signal peptidase I [Staphylococcus equorum subsp. linens]QQT16666.1 signal peptidase I [Staphylococcus equorum]